MTTAVNNTEWIRLLNDLLTRQWREVTPRGMATREMLNKTTVTEMWTPVITVPQRKLGYRFMCAEAAWILSGDNRLETILPYARAIEQFSDDGLFFHGAYGPPIVDQLSYVTDALVRDRDTRQAVLTIWRKRPVSTKDVPCTISMQFLIRDSELHCITNMRSSDAWLGWPYDQFNFSCVAALVGALYMRRTDDPIKLGYLHINMGSSHLYERNYEDADDVVRSEKTEPLFRVGVLSPGDWAHDPFSLVRHLWEVADAGKSERTRRGRGGEFLGGLYEYLIEKESRS